MDRNPDRPLTQADFVGASMSSFLYDIAQNLALDEPTRNRAKILSEQWDSVSPVKTPEKALAVGETK